MGQRGSWEPSSPSCTPQLGPNPRGTPGAACPSAAPCAEQRSKRKRRDNASLPFILGGHMAHTCPGVWGPPELQRVRVMSAQLPRSPIWPQISSFIVVIADASTTATVKIKLLRAEIRPRPSPTPGEGAAFYHRGAEAKGTQNIRRSAGDGGDFLQPAERGIACRENEEGLSSGRA